MRDGSYYSGEFNNGEMTGEGEFHSANGAVYVGQFHLGEKHGRGKLISEQCNYDGEWHMNWWHGEGVLTTPEYSIDGVFYQHKPHGVCRYESPEYQFQGEYVYGKKNGQGVYTSNTEQYEGQFKDDLMDGQGKLIKRGQPDYIYTGEFQLGQATLQVNKLRYKLDQIVEPVDPKAKKGEPQIDLATTIVYELKSTKTITFDLELIYQGGDIEDPVQPTQQEIDELVKNWQKEAKKQKNPPPMPDFNIKRMVAPAPIEVTQESGRQLQITLIQKTEPITQFRVDYREKIRQRKEEIEKLKEEIEAQKLLEEQQQLQPPPKGKKDLKKQAKKPELETVDFSIKLFDEQDKESIIVTAEEGRVRVEGLEYPEDFPAGKYYYVISNLNDNCIGQFENVEIELIVQAEAKQQVGKKK